MTAPSSRVSRNLYIFATAVTVVAAVCLGVSFIIEHEIFKAFSLGAFFASVIGSVFLFGFAKITASLEDIRTQVDSNRGLVDELYNRLDNEDDQETIKRGDLAP